MLVQQSSYKMSIGNVLKREGNLHTVEGGKRRKAYSRTQELFPRSSCFELNINFYNIIMLIE